MRCLSLPKRDGSPRSWRSTTPLCMAVGSTWLRSNSRYWLANVYRTASQRSLRCKSALLFGSLNAIRLRQASTGVLRRPMPASSSSISIQLSNEGGQSTSCFYADCTHLSGAGRQKDPLGTATGSSGEWCYSSLPDPECCWRLSLAPSEGCVEQPGGVVYALRAHCAGHLQRACSTLDMSGRIRAERPAGGARTTKLGHPGSHRYGRCLRWRASDRGHLAIGYERWSNQREWHANGAYGPR